MRFTETNLKQQIKDLLAIKRIFNFPILQGLGCYPGIPDRVMHYRGRVIYLECKLPGKALSQKQQEFQAQCKADGVDYWVVHSPEELLEMIDSIPRPE